MIKIRDLKRNFKEYNFNIECRNLTVDKGKSFGIYGDTASGKTLFSMLISGVIKNYSGSIEIALTELSSTYRKKIGYLPFKNVLYNYMTVKEVSKFLLSQYKTNKSEFDPKLEWFSQFYNLSQILDRKINSLTDGQLQMAKLFVSLIHSPVILIIDEPFNGLGSESVKIINSVIQSLNYQEVTVLSTSSNRDYLKEITDEITTITKGKVE
ncbi:MAG: ATP-binding cassette domain-containing protein [Candidatus Delongbacteria bacterium]|nr:ATP-binding cassette domain-containing protein [Candidatus Delongbacteria bacterium]